MAQAWLVPPKAAVCRRAAASGACVCPSEAKFQTPCAFLIKLTFGRSRLSESTSTDLLSKGNSFTETLNN